MVCQVPESLPDYGWRNQDVLVSLSNGGKHGRFVVEIPVIPYEFAYLRLVRLHFQEKIDHPMQVTWSSQAAALAWLKEFHYKVDVCPVTAVSLKHTKDQSVPHDKVLKRLDAVRTIFEDRTIEIAAVMNWRRHVV